MVASIIAVTPATGGSGVSLSGTDFTIPAISGYVPLLGDRLYVFGNCNTQSITPAATADWSLAYENVITTTNAAFLRGHAITPAEVAAGTNSWTGTFLSAGSAAGRGVAVVVRGADSHVTATAQGTLAAVTPAAVTPGRDGSLILTYVAPDDLARGIGDPGPGWTNLAKGSGNTGVTSQLLARRTALAPAGAAVDMTNAAVTLNANDEWAAITIAVDQPAPRGGIFACL